MKMLGNGRIANDAQHEGLVAGDALKLWAWIMVLDMGLDIAPSLFDT